MCKVWIVCGSSVRVIEAAALQPAARIKPVQAPIVPTKPVAKKLPQNNWRRSATPAPLQCGGDLLKSFPDERFNKKDTVSHFSQRTGEHNHREQACFETARRQGVVHF